MKERRKANPNRDTSYSTSIDMNIKFCPRCGKSIEELDCTTFYCEHCDSQFQIEYELPDHYLSSQPTVTEEKK